MGRSFESVRMGVKDVSARWLKASRALKKEDQVDGQKIAEMAKKHSSEAFYALDDPLEAAAVFSVLVELLKTMDKADRKNGENEIEGKSIPQSRSECAISPYNPAHRPWQRLNRLLKCGQAQYPRRQRRSSGTQN
jgi:hypothetical protein